MNTKKMKNYVIYVFIFRLLSSVKQMLKEPWNIRMECNEAGDLFACATEWHSQACVSAVKRIKTTFSKWAATRKIMSALIILIFSCSLLNIWCFFFGSRIFFLLQHCTENKNRTWTHFEVPSRTNYCFSNQVFQFFFLSFSINNRKKRNSIMQ